MHDTYTWDDRHALLKTAEDADQSERDAMISGTAPIESGLRDDAISGVVSDEDSPEGKLEEWDEEDGKTESLAGNIIEEIERRKQILGNFYPFSLQDSRLRYTGSHTFVYEFCLAICMAEKLTGKPWGKLPIQFELLSAELSRRLLSPVAKVIRTGWPSHDKVARPVRFKALAQIINTASNEWIWSPSEPNSDDPDPKVVKDEGVDFVAWIPFGDNRAGQPFLLGQCACGNNWVEKFYDLNKDSLEKWLRPPTYAPFQRALAIPMHIPGWHVFATVAQHAGIPFDRARLTLVAESTFNRAEVATMFRARLGSLIQLVFPRFKQIPAVAS